MRYRRAPSIPGKVTSSTRSLKSPMAAILHLILFGILLAPPTFAQQQSGPAVSPATDRARGARVFTLSAELQSRLQALESAKQAGDPAVITTTSRSVLALGLREMGDTEVMQASAPAAIETYRRSLDFENSLATRTDLSLAYLCAEHLDESLSVITDVLIADPENARAWYVQGKGLDGEEAIRQRCDVVQPRPQPAGRSRSFVLAGCCLSPTEGNRESERDLSQVVGYRARTRGHPPATGRRLSRSQRYR